MFFLEQLPGNPRGTLPGAVLFIMPTNHLEKLKNSKSRKFTGVSEWFEGMETKANCRISKAFITLSR